MNAAYLVILAIGTAALHDTGRRLEMPVVAPSKLEAAVKSAMDDPAFQQAAANYGVRLEYRNAPDYSAFAKKAFADEGAIVLDNCIGSGTTAVACIRSGRNYIGFELDAKHYETACKRIENELADRV